MRVIWVWLRSFDGGMDRKCMRLDMWGYDVMSTFSVNELGWLHQTKTALFGPDHLYYRKGSVMMED